MRRVTVTHSFPHPLSHTLKSVMEKELNTFRPPEMLENI